MNDTLHCEPVELELVGLDGNAFSLMGAFSRAEADTAQYEKEYENKD